MLPKFFEGEIKGAKYEILAAREPSGKLLLLAHGYRKEEQPLSAGFETKGTLATAPFVDGWAIAWTSFRRKGWIVDDALVDLRSLQEKFVELQGNPVSTFLIGNSRGGQIAVRAAEGGLETDGAITTRAALQVIQNAPLALSSLSSPRF